MINVMFLIAYFLLGLLFCSSVIFNEIRREEQLLTYDDKLVLIFMCGMMIFLWPFCALLLISKYSME